VFTELDQHKAEVNQDKSISAGNEDKYYREGNWTKNFRR
jgi:hypothetical protein